MARVFNGEFALMAWLDPNREEPDEFIDSDECLSLERQAERLLKGGKYKYIEIIRWNYTEQDYTDVLKVYPDDAGPLPVPEPLTTNKSSKTPPTKIKKRRRLKMSSSTKIKKSKTAPKKQKKRGAKSSVRRKRKATRS